MDQTTLSSTDPFSKEKRSSVMGSVPQRNTKPERLVRSALHRMGYRFRLNRRNLPGSPDIVLPKWRTVLFVHGCFWHRHPGCRLTTTPKQNAAFWQAKFDRNQERDIQVVGKLKELGWKSVTVWECETKVGSEKLEARLRELLAVRLQDFRH